MAHHARDTGAAATLVVLVVLGAVQSRQDAVVVAVATALALPAAAVVAARTLPRWHVAGLCALTAGAVAVLCTGQPGNPGWFAVCVLVWWCVMRAGAGPATWLTGAILTALVVEWARAADESGWGNWVAGTLFTLVVTRLARRQGELLDELRAAQAAVADRARIEERNRIARELHDVIGHALTVSLLHVTSARLALADDPDDAVASLAEAERLAQRSLAEVRRAVGMMRDDEGGAGHGARVGGGGGAGLRDGQRVAPLPGADEIPQLVEQVRRAGTPVVLEVVGRSDGLPDTVGLTIYRVVQEALTNVARHAPGAATTVRLEYGDTATRLTVTNARPAGGAPARHAPVAGGPADGPAVSGASTRAPGRDGERRGADETSRPGLGLVGMRERVDVVGGRLRVGPERTGWVVEAEVPR